MTGYERFKQVMIRAVGKRPTCDQLIGRRGNGSSPGGMRNGRAGEAIFAFGFGPRRSGSRRRGKCRFLSRFRSSAPRSCRLPAVGPTMARSGNDRLPVFGGGMTYCAIGLLTWLRVRVELLSLVADHFRVRFSACAERSVWPRVLMAYSDFGSAIVKWDCPHSTLRSGDLMMRRWYGIAFDWWSGGNHSVEDSFFVPQSFHIASNVRG